MIDDYALFITTILNAHGKVHIQISSRIIINKLQQTIANLNEQLLSQAHQDLLVISIIDDQELWKTCAEYWVKFVSDTIWRQRRKL